MTAYDLLIKNGTIVDGTRVPKYRADLAIKDGKVLQIDGRLEEADAERVLDATGLIVAPGFVDLHTHYDAQIQWDPWCSISGWHGVTSVVLGNCGFGFAPVRADERDRAMLTMSRTEAIPFESMQMGMLWDWITFPEYLDTLDRIPKGVNCLSYVPIAPLMIWAMGLEAAKSRPATPSERAEMQRLLNEAMEAGACGFSLQRLGPNSAQADYDGTPMVTDTMAEEDIYALGEVLRERGEGFIQINNSFTGNQDVDLAVQERLAEISGRPIIHNLVGVSAEHPEFHRKRLAWLERCNDEGLRIYGQGVTIRPGFAFTMEHWNLYDSSPAWNYATTGTYEEKLLKLREPKVREGIKAETAAAIEESRRVNAVGGPIEDLVVQSVDQCENAEELEHYVGWAVGALAEREGKDPIDMMLDLSLEGGLRVEFVGQSRGPQRRVHGRDDHLAVHGARRVRWRRAHQVLHRRFLHHRLPRLAGAGRGRGDPRGGALPLELSAGGGGRVQGPWLHPRRFARRHRGLRPRGAEDSAGGPRGRLGRLRLPRRRVAPDSVGRRLPLDDRQR